MTETGAQLFSRLEGRRCLRDIEPRLFPDDGGPEQGEVVEIHGLEGTGKTELLYHVLCRCILPQEAGGLQLEVVFIDTDLNFDLLRLVTVLEARLTAGVSSDSEDDDGSALRLCLSRLLLLQCSSSSQLLLSLVSLDSAFAARPGLSLLLIDSVSAFYWLDRCGGGESPANQEQTLRKCSEQLERLLRDYRFTVFASCQAILKNYRSSGSSHSSSNPAPSCSPASWQWDRQYLCRPWQRLVSHRLLCARQPGTNMDACAGGAKMAACTGGANMAAAASSSSSTTSSTGGGAANPQSRQVFTCHCSSNKTKAQRHTSFRVTEGGVVFT